MLLVPCPLVTNKKSRSRQKNRNMVYESSAHTKKGPSKFVIYSRSLSRYHGHGSSLCLYGWYTLNRSSSLVYVKSTQKTRKQILTQIYARICNP